MPLDGWDHVEMWVGNAKQAAFFYEQAFGFTRTAYAGPETGVRDRASYVLEQGEIRFVVTSALRQDHEIAHHSSRHGDGVKDIALGVPDATDAYRQAVQRGARGVIEPHTVEDEFGQVELSAIGTYGDTIHSFVNRKGYEGPYLPGYKLGRMDHWVEFYERVMGFTEMIHFSDEAISTEYSALMSKVMSDGQGKIKFPINEPAEGKRKSQIEEYLELYGGPGVQHVAMTTSNIVETVEALKERGIGFLETPETYYEDVGDRVGEIDESWDDLRRLRILADRDDDGYLLQIFTKTAQDRPTARAASGTGISRRSSRRSSASRLCAATFEALHVRGRRPRIPRPGRRRPGRRARRSLPARMARGGWGGGRRARTGRGAAPSAHPAPSVSARLLRLRAACRHGSCPARARDGA
jgi:4-hydroxyphenylpyruvate dioxygenase